MRIKHVSVGRYTKYAYYQCIVREIEKYDYNSTIYNSGAGHFMQIVWPSTRYIGMGIAFSEEDKTYIVAQYLQGVNGAPNVIPKPISGTN